MSQGNETDHAMELRTAVEHFRTLLLHKSEEIIVKDNIIETLNDSVKTQSARADDAVWRWFAWKLAAILLMFIVFALSITLFYYH